MRLAVICDFQKLRPSSHLMWQIEGLETPHSGGAAVVRVDGRVSFPPPAGDPAQAGCARCKMIWHHDSVEFAPPCPTDRSGDNMWRHWNLGRNPVQGDVRCDEQGPWWEKYKAVAAFGPHTPILALRDIATFDAIEQCWRLVPGA